MSDSIKTDLLQPSLSGARPRQAPYSSRVGFLGSFFGGPAAACAIGFFNSQRMGRLKRDLPWLGALLLAYLLTYWALVRTIEGRHIQDAIDTVLNSSGAGQLQMRVLGLLAFGLISLMHARERRATHLIAGLESPNGTLLGVLVIGGGWLTHYFLLRGLAALP